MRLPTLSLKGRALRLLSGREHSRAELERKLAAHEEEPGQLARTLDELQAKGFISEQRVVESVIHRRQAKLGAARIRQELQAKGLAPEAVAGAMASLKESEFARAREVWQRKFGRAADERSPPAERGGHVAAAAERGRQMRFLLSRGFGAEVVRRVVAGGDDD